MAKAVKSTAKLTPRAKARRLTLGEDDDIAVRSPFLKLWILPRRYGPRKGRSEAPW